MTIMGTEQTIPNGYHEPMSSHQAETPRAPAGAPDKAPARNEPAAHKEETSLDSILQFAKDLQSKLKDVPYLVPVACGAAGFALGVLASSRILRQVTMMAGAYGVRYAVQNAPKDEILGFAKKVLLSSLRGARVA